MLSKVLKLYDKVVTGVQYYIKQSTFLFVAVLITYIIYSFIFDFNILRVATACGIILTFVFLNKSI